MVEEGKTDMDGVPGKFSPRAARFWIAVLIMLALFTSSTVRLDLSMAVVCMVKAPPPEITPTADFTQLAPTVVPAVVETAANPQCQLDNSTAASKYAGYNGDIELSPKQISLLLSAAFYGGIATVWGASLLTDRFSKKYVVLLAVGSSVMSAFLFPTLVRISFWAAFVGRIFIGLGQGIAIPSMVTVAANWFPANEIASYAAMYTSGNQIAAVTAMPVSSFLCSTDYGWPLIFYTFGSVGLIWVVLWVCFVSSTPDAHRFIGDKEKEYLLTHVDTARKANKRNPMQVPYKSILTCAPFWACVIANVSFNFSAVLMQTYLPTFLKQVLQVKLKNNGLIAMFPFLMQIITKNIAGNVGDALRKQKVLSATASVRIFQLTGNLGAASCFVVLMNFIDCTNAFLGGLVIAVFGAFLSCGIPGFMTTFMIIAPKYTGTMISMSLFAGSIANAAAPGLVGLINKNGTKAEWNIIWSCAIALHVISAVVFFIFASAEVQPWAKDPERERAPTEAEKLELEKKDIELLSVEKCENL